MKKKFVVNFVGIVFCLFSFSFLFTNSAKAASLSVNQHICSDGTVASVCYNNTQIYNTENGRTYPSVVFSMDGQIGYCIEPGVDETETPGAYSPSNWGATVHSQSTINKLELIAHFGFGYGDHTSYLWYVATQKLIWETVQPGLNVELTVGSNRAPFNVDSYVAEINRLVNDFLTAPSFAGQTIKGKVGKK